MDNLVVDITGYGNPSHNSAWAYKKNVFVHPCARCMAQDRDDALLEMFLRFQITHKLFMEDDNFDVLYEKYQGIQFNFCYQNTIVNGEKVVDEISLVEFFIQKKATIGVCFRWMDFDYSDHSFSIPILKGGKMWQIMMNKMFVLRDDKPVDKKEWSCFKPEPMRCLFCLDYPRDFYPGNFVVNQNILFLRSFIWVDKRKLHRNKRTNSFIMYNESSKIIKMPFLDKTCDQNIQLNFLGNMAFFPPGKVFPSFIEIIISKLQRLKVLNKIIQQLRIFHRKKMSSDQGAGDSFQTAGISVRDLVGMYKICKKTKNYDITEKNDGSFSISKRRSPGKDNKEIEMVIGERLLIDLIEDSRLLSNPRASSQIAKWFQFPVTPFNERHEVTKIIQALKRGEIDKSISQTSKLNKDFEVTGDDIHYVMGTVKNLDVHRIGRFSQNAPSNSFSNICNIACSLQKVLTKDSKTKEPRYITDSERGFIDLTHTPDTPKNSGLIVEAVVDTLISTSSLTAVNCMHEVLTTLFPLCIRVENSCELENLDDKFVYILANQVLYKTLRTIPANLLLDGTKMAYVVEQYGSCNLFRMTQYALKIIVPFIELIQHKNGLLWECNSYDRNIYKLHVDGLFYSPREFLSFYEDDPDSQLWIGRTGNKIPNIFGPSIRLTPHPNKCHLQRVGHATFSAKNFVGIATNSLTTGQLHQKTVTTAFYNAKTYPSEIINLPGCYPKILVASGFNNQEDGICVRKGAIDSGMFSATCYETAAVKVFGRVKFTQTISKGQVLRIGCQIGVISPMEDLCTGFINAQYGSLQTETYSNELKVIEMTAEGGEGNATSIANSFHNRNCFLSIVWVGKGQMSDTDNPCNDYFINENPKMRRSMAFQEKNPNYQKYRCEGIQFNDIEDSQYSKLYLSYASLFCPSVGDKLQTTTANKGVITEIISDEDMPYVINEVMGKKTMLMPDLIINPHFLKRQTLDNIYTTGEKISGGINSFMNKCFSFDMSDSVRYLLMGDLFASGILMNPLTGYPYLTPIQVKEGDHCYDYPTVENYDFNDGFSYLGVKKDFRPHCLTKATIYTTRYFLVHNHKAAKMMQASHPEDIITTEFTGAPIKGKKGGFSTGPQEQMALVGLGAERLNFEISQFRSEFSSMTIDERESNGSLKETVVIPASKTLKRAIDEIRQYDIEVNVKVRKCNTMVTNDPQKF